jgi:hypothetical protein
MFNRCANHPNSSLLISRPLYLYQATQLQQVNILKFKMFPVSSTKIQKMKDASLVGVRKFNAQTYPWYMKQEKRHKINELLWF